MDTYGHYLQRAVTHISKQSLEPHFDQEFVLDLEGTQTLRVLCYEEITGQQKPFFRGKANLELSQTWLSDKVSQQLLPILDVKTVLLSFLVLIFRSLVYSHSYAEICVVPIKYGPISCL